MRQSKLLQLPPELLDSIIRKVPSTDLLTLRQTCKHLSYILSPIVFQSLCGESYFTDERQRRLLIATANSESTMALYVRNIQFKSPISPFLGSVSSRSQGRGNESNNIVSTPKEKVPMKPEEVIVKYLVPFMEKFIKLNRVTWGYRSNFTVCDPKLYLQNLTSALVKLPSLKELSLTVWQYASQDPMPDLSGFKNLHSLEVHLEIGSETENYLRSSVMPAIAASPRLVTLHLSTREKGYSIGLHTLMHEFNIWRTSDSESTSTTSYLQDFKLVNIPVQLSSLHIRRVFQNLKHLTLLHGNVWDCENTISGIPWVEIWKALTDAGINDGLWLETLNAEPIQPPNGLNTLLQYLAVHPGLKGLSIRRPPYTVAPRAASRNLESADTPGSSEEEIQENLRLATLFWKEIVPRFARSLRELTVNPYKEGPWSYGPNASKALSQCTGLKKLHISVSNVPEDWAKEKAANLEILIPPPEPMVTQSDWEYVYLKNIGRTGPIRWGKLESSPILVASDLGNMIGLEEVKIRLAAQDIDHGWCGTGEREDRRISLNEATNLLERFVPWEGYPHKLLGENGIVTFDH